MTADLTLLLKLYQMIITHPEHGASEIESIQQIPEINDIISGIHGQLLLGSSLQQLYIDIYIDIYKMQWS
jgi:hypothetical protein